MQATIKRPKRSARRKKIAAVIIIVIVVLLALGLTFIGNYFFNYALNPNAADAFESGSSDSEYEPTPSDIWLEDSGASVYLTSEDGLQLHARQILQPEEENHRWAVVCHGYKSNGSRMADYAAAFYQRGFSVLVPDARGHGQSEGDYIGMGWPERRDIVGWTNMILEHDPDAEIILFGVSMGAATVMMTAGEADLPANVKLAIEDCGYTSVWDEFSVQLNDLFGLPPFPIIPVTSLVCKARAGYFFGEASAEAQVAKATIPMLFIHGQEDAFVPYSMLQEVYDAANCPKEILSVPGAAHAESAAVSPELYWSTIDQFLDTYL